MAESLIVKHGNVDKLVDHLFRHEAGKMVSVLTRTFGVENIEIAEDVVQDALVQAVQTWPIRGIPDNPSAWLYRAAKNKAIDILRHSDHSVRLDPLDESSLADPASPFQDTLDDLWREDLVKDDMLRMMFACCHPGIPEENQVTLILKTLCGFSTAEIARAFLTSEDTISKRLYRTRLYFRKHRIQFILPPPTELKSRTDTVLNSIYLLFNEGYSSTVSESLVREDLMEEAMLLCRMLTENPSTAMPETFALMALMCFHASRNDGRTTPAGEIILLADQDRSKWNRGLIALGNEFMAKAAAGDSASRYHIEAAIAFEHCTAKHFEETDWKRILELYEWLCRAFPSPISELNRAVAVMRVHGADEALKTVAAIREKKIESYFLYHSLVGEIYSRLDMTPEANAEFAIAVTLTKSETERKLLRSKLAGMEHFPDDGADFSR